MNLFNKLLVLFLFIVFLFSCQEKKKSALISTDIDMEGVKEIVLSDHLSGYRDTIRTLVEYNEVPVKEPTFLNISYGKNYGNLFVKPGAVIDLQSEGDRLVVKGSLYEENELMYKINEELNRIRAEYPIHKIGRLSQDEYLDKLQEKYKFTDSLLASATELDPTMTRLVNKRIEASKIQDKLMYPKYYSYYQKDTIPLASDYYDFLAEIDINDPEMLAFVDGAEVIGQLLTHDSKAKSATEYFRQMYIRADSILTNEKVKDFQLHKALSEKLSFGGGIDGMEDLIDQFLATSTNEKYKKEIQDLADEWAYLAKGKVAPGFDGVTPQGETISLADLKGTHVYVDVWATWCGPCIREIPSLKKLEKDYHDENIAFVSVSIDKQKDKEKWKFMIEDRDLGGIQIMEEGDWRSEIAQSYRIKGIPRFLLIDKEGNIIMANAPRPSSSAIREMLDDLKS